MKSLRLISTAPPTPSLSLSRTRAIFKVAAKRCGGGFATMSLSANPEKSSSSSHGRASISVLEDQSISSFKMKLGSSVSPPRFINPLAKTMSRSDQAFLLLAFIACTVKDHNFCLLTNSLLFSLFCFKVCVLMCCRLQLLSQVLCLQQFPHFW